MNLREQIEIYIPYNEQEKSNKKVTLKYMDDYDNLLTRDNEFAHFTSTGLVVNKDKTKVLMIYHNLFKAWSLPGGHADGEDNLLNVAIKEVKEETNINNLKVISPDIFSLDLFCIDGHMKRGKYVSSHIHINTIYLLEGDDSEELKIKEDENSGVMWVDINEVVEKNNQPYVKEIYQKVLHKLNNK